MALALREIEAAPVAPRAMVPRRQVGAPVVVVAAAVLGVVVPLVLALATGSLAIPHNDGWSYSRIAALFARTGAIRMLGWNRAALVGQFVVLGPLGRFLELQQTFVALCGVAVLTATYDLLLAFVGRRRAAFAALVVASWPAFGLLATSFMLDVPSTAAAMCCLAAGRRAIEASSWRLLLVSAGLGLWGFTIREQALAAPVAVLLVAALDTRRGLGGFRWTVLGGVTTAFVSAAVAFEAWRLGLPDGNPPALAVPPALVRVTVDAAGHGWFVLALAVLPAVLLVARPWEWRGGAVVASLVACVVGVAAVVGYRPAWFFGGNYLQPAGPYWESGNGQPAAVIPTVVWDLVIAAACVSGLLLAGLLVRRARALPPLVLVTLVLEVAGNLGTAVAGQPLFDRYWLPVVPLLLAVVLSEPREGRPAARSPWWLPAGVSAAGLLTVSLALTAAGMAYDTARWHVATELVAGGISADHVDAGLEWTGYHSRVGMAPPASWEFPGSLPCVVVSASPPAPATPARVVEYQTFVVAGTSRLWIYDTGWPGCPAAEGP